MPMVLDGGCSDEDDQDEIVRLERPRSRPQSHQDEEAQPLIASPLKRKGAQDKQSSTKRLRVSGPGLKRKHPPTDDASNKRPRILDPGTGSSVQTLPEIRPPLVADSQGERHTERHLDTHSNQPLPARHKSKPTQVLRPKASSLKKVGPVVNLKDRRNLTAEVAWRTGQSLILTSDNVDERPAQGSHMELREL
ncbi:hypothetical protein K491DRAFT_699667 [Lophiostoma macrostomum CBS 122681]|uniref:Uncharacterized protein n=1 Tax=Lophiostoma macrostomum CBS 122681 TaxID=1314788 RepID=A0A6A6SLX2_9PLEO|nr:hypothetical protein K491DRAFT_699667 [Lophiostoma macrostomum CBS 122681]